MRSRNIRIDGYPGIEATAALRHIRPVSLAGRHGRNGRPRFVPTVEHCHQVEALAGFGLTRQQIASVIINPQTARGISYVNLERYFREELHRGRARANLAVVQNLFRLAIGNGPGAVKACIWWTKCRMGWRAADPAHDQVDTPSPPNLDRAKQELARLVGKELRLHCPE